MRLAIILLLLSRLSTNAQVIFSSDGSPQNGVCQSPPARFVERPDGILALPGEFSGATTFSGRMRPRVFAYNQIQTGPAPRAERVVSTSSYPWKLGISTTVFWIGEPASVRNPVDNLRSAWDRDWMLNYGGADTPDSSRRQDFRPISFVPRENPFYVALPYNDQVPGGIREEASKVIPWFDPVVAAQGKSNLKGRWLAVRKGSQTCYAQWEDVGPFEVDNWEYVFGNERPRPNRNRDAGIDVSPAVRDYLGLAGIDVTDWRFVEAGEVPDGPWKHYGQDEPATVASVVRKGEVKTVHRSAGFWFLKHSASMLNWEPFGSEAKPSSPLGFLSSKHSVCIYIWEQARG
jgi:hypothetical protein